MARGVEKCDCAALMLDLVGADMLRDAPVLARGDMRLADVVQQRGFAMVHVAHEGHDRRTRHQIAQRVHSALRLRFRLERRGRRGRLLFVFEHKAMLFGDYFGDLELDLHADGGEDVQAHQFGDEHVGLDTEHLGEILHHHVPFDGDDLAGSGFGRRFRGRFGSSFRRGGFGGLRYRRGGLNRHFRDRFGGGFRRGGFSGFGIIDALDFVAQVLFQFGRQMGLCAARGAAPGLQEPQELLARGH